MSDVFISYSRKDIAFARLIIESLKQNQIEPWIDWREIEVGQDFWAEICEAITKANTFLFIVSKKSIDSSYCKQEIDFAFENKKRIIPVLVDDLQPDTIEKFDARLPKINWVIFEKDRIFRIEENPQVKSDKPEESQVALPLPPHFEEALGKLGTAIHADWEWVKFHTQLQLDALEWKSNLSNPSYLARGAVLEKYEQQLLRASGKDPQPTDLQLEYVTASRKDETLRQEQETVRQQEQLRLEQEKVKFEQKARQRQRWVIWAVCIGLAVAISLGVLALGQRNVAVSQSDKRATAEVNAINQQSTAQAASTEAIDQRNIAVTRQLASEALYQADKQFDLALLLALEADRSGLGATWASGNLLEVLQANPRLTQFLRGHTLGVHSVAYSPDGQTLATGGGGGAIILWDVSDLETSKQLSQVNDGIESNSVAFSPNGQILASGGYKTITLWDVSDPKAPRQLSQPVAGHTNEVNSVAFNPDGKLLASGSSDDTIILWDISQPEMPKKLGQTAARVYSLMANSVNSIAFSPDGKTLASGSTDGTVILWDIGQPDTPKQIGNPLVGNNGIVYSVAFSPDGKKLASGGSNDTVILWDISQQETPIQIGQLAGHTSSVVSVAFSPDGENLASGSWDDTIILWDVSQPETPKQLDQPLAGHSQWVNSIAFSPDGLRLASGGSNNNVILWDISHAEAPKPLGQRLNVPGASELVAYSVQGKIAASVLGDENNTINMWDTSHPEAPKRIGQLLTGHAAQVTSIVFSADGKMMASRSSDDAIILWNLSQLATPKIILTSKSSYLNIAFSPDGKMLALENSDKTITLWDISQPEARKIIGQPLTGHANMPISVSFSPDGKSLASWGDDNNIVLWDISHPETPKIIGQPLTGHAGTVLSVTFSPDGKMLASGGEDNHIILWDIRQPDAPKPIGQPLVGHTDSVDSVAFSPDGKRLVSGSHDNTIILWDVSQPDAPQPIGKPLVGQSSWVKEVAFSSDGNTLASESIENTVIIWDVSPEAWIERACRVAGRNLTQAEWDQYMPSTEPYQITCPNFPSGQAATTTPTPAVSVSSLTQSPTQIPPTLTSTSIPPSPTEIPISPTLSGTSTTWDVNLVDVFLSNINGWKAGSETACGVESMNIQNGQMLWKIVSKKGCVYNRLPKMPVVLDFDAAVDMLRVPGSIVSYYGISFRHQDSNNYYVFIINDTDLTYSVWAYQNAWRTIIGWTPSSAILPDKANHIGVSARGSNFTFSINNQQVGAATDTGISSGNVGIASWIANPKTGDKFSVTVDNFELHFNNPK